MSDRDLLAPAGLHLELAAPPAVAPAADAEPARALEREFAATLDLPPEHVVAVGDTAEAYRTLLEAGRAALEGEHAEVIVPALLGAPAARAALALGVPAVPAEVDAAAATLSARGLAAAIGEQPAVVVAVHAFGHPAPLDELVRLTEGRPVAFVEDASEAVGASLRGVPAGRMAEAAIVAFAPGRLLSGDDGNGALLVFRDRERAVSLRATSTALNERIARIALAELRAMDEELEARRQLAWELTLNLRGARALVAMPHGRWIRHAYSRYVVRIRSLLWKRSLDETIDELRAAGLACERACAPSLHLDPAVREVLADDSRLADDRFPAASSLPDELIALPLRRGLTSRDMADIARVLRHLEERST